VEEEKDEEAEEKEEEDEGQVQVDRPQLSKPLSPYNIGFQKMELYLTTLYRTFSTLLGRNF